MELRDMMWTFTAVICSMCVLVTAQGGQAKKNDLYSNELLFKQNRSELNAQVHAKILESKTKAVNITCPELNNITFNNNPPFDHLGIPQCGDKVLPEMVLYLPPPSPKGGKHHKNKTTIPTDFVSCTLEPANLPNNQSRVCFEKLKADRSVWKVVILTHGFTKSFDTPWLHSMQKKIMTEDPGTAVIVSICKHSYLSLFLLKYPLPDRRLGRWIFRRDPLLPSGSQYQVYFYYSH